ncbi:LysR family transcriptional regulator [Tsukamurella paurometabola]|uniref:LysR family transcriptional regulator n=1 Tax=Tsukamurella paurometabola TaxID=2061 RepID=A0ABS5NDQ8_TSUPA|nr:LysR family transcriptional regulator [Tsukamurella paurometabola]MBS4102190.1 LysR family transcriptional regulator [Tsukamurella paurometabola]
MHTPEPSADGLLTLLAVARTGRYTAAADLLGINHTTASRRVAALEQALGGPLLARGAAGWELTELGRSGAAAAERIEAVLHGLDADTAHDLHGTVRIAATDGFSARVVAPTIAELGRAHPRLSVDLLTVTRRAPSTRSGVDIEVVVGRPETYRVEPELLAPYRLGLYGSRQYLATDGTPENTRDLAGRPLVYFIDSMLTVDDLDLARVLVPDMTDRLSSTNVLVHVEATCAGAGLGLLPCFLADSRPDLVRVLPDEVSVQLEYWMVVRPEAAQRREVAAVVTALRAQVAAMRAVLLGAIPHG